MTSTAIWFHEHGIHVFPVHGKEPAAPALPSIQGVSALASVNGEPVSWNAFVDALTSVHAEAGSGTRRAKQNPQALLDRLITGKLIAQEARNIGLDQTPEFKAAVTTFREETLATTLLARPANGSRIAVRGGVLAGRVKDLLARRVGQAVGVEGALQVEGAAR